jgi:dCTP deaminase
MLTGDEIADLVLNKGHIEIEPFDRVQIQPNGYDVRLAPLLYRITDAILDLKRPYAYEELEIPDSGLLIRPEECYLGVTLERTFSPVHVPVYEGRSTMGRYFLHSHQTAGFGDVGFNGHWTLEITCRRPTVIYPRMRIGQISFTPIVGKPVQYNGSYHGSCVPVLGRPNNL